MARVEHLSTTLALRARRAATLRPIPRVAGLIVSLLLFGAGTDWLAAQTSAQYGGPGAAQAPRARSRPTSSGEIYYTPKDAENVVDVRVEGNQTVASQAIFSQVKTRAGRPFDPRLVQSDVRRLMSKSWFLDVQPRYQKVADGVIVVFRVAERPTLRYVQYVGNRKIKDKHLTKQTGLKYGDALDPYAIEEGRRKIEEYYHEKGFNDVQVTVWEGLKPTDLGAIYVINEGQKQKVKGINFKGNTIASGGRLKTQIRTKKAFLGFFKGEVNREQVDQDVDRLTDYYRSLGFFEAKVSRVLDFEKDGDLTVTFVIYEGPRFRIREISFIGNEVVDSTALAGKLTLKSGDFFDRKQLVEDTTSLRDVYGTRGYVYADVRPDPRYLEEPGQIDLIFDISEGKRYRVGDIHVHIAGDNPHTRIQPFLNRVPMAPGDVMNSTLISKGKRAIERSGLVVTNPAQGKPPSILVKPPEVDEEQLAKRRQRESIGSGFRGQSPDVGPLRWYGAGSTNGRPQPHRGRNQAPPRDLRRSGPVAVRGQSPTATSSYGGAAGYGGHSVGAVGPNDSYSQPAAYQPTPNGYASQPGATGGAPTGPVFRAPTYPTAPGGAAAGTPAFPSAFTTSPSGQFPGFYDPYNGGMPDPRTDLDIYVEEAQTGRFMAGVGVNSDAGLVGNVSITERNFDIWRYPRSFEDIRNGYAWRGGGQSFRIEAMPGTEVQRYMVNFTEPYLFDTPISFGVSGFLYDRRYEAWDEQRLGGRLSFGYQFSPDLSTLFTFRGEEVQLSNPQVSTFGTVPPEVAAAVGNNELYGFKGTLAHDTRDSQFLATRGHYIETSFEQVVGSFRYPRGEFDFRQYFMLRQRPDGSGRHVLSLTSRVGITGDNTPVYDNFFAGGYSTLRGWDFRGASPVVGGVAVGGEFMWINSVEYLFPITADDMLRGVAFVDFGTVERDVEIQNFRVAPGVGLRITVPALGPAPIALDFAFPVLKADFDDTRVFSFNIGYQK